MRKSKVNVRIPNKKVLGIALMGAVVVAAGGFIGCTACGQKNVELYDESSSEVKSSSENGFGLSSEKGFSTASSSEKSTTDSTTTKSTENSTATAGATAGAGATTAAGGTTDTKKGTASSAKGSKGDSEMKGSTGSSASGSTGKSSSGKKMTKGEAEMKMAESVNGGSQTPAAQTPAAQTPAAQTPAAQTPAVANVPATTQSGGQLIAEQTFEKNLKPLGDVSFCSYAPSKDKPKEDVTFKICDKKGKEVATLPGMTENNERKNKTFCKVQAASFADYNHDGNNDIITVCSYKPNGKSSKEVSEARLYCGSANGAYELEKKESEKVNKSLSDITVNSILKFLGTGSSKTQTNCQSVCDWKQAFIDKLKSMKQDSNVLGYNLVYIDGDKIPEIEQIKKAGEIGTSLLYYCCGDVVQQDLACQNFSYIPNEGILCDWQGGMDILLQLKNGIMQQIGQCAYGSNTGKVSKGQSEMGGNDNSWYNQILGYCAQWFGGGNSDCLDINWDQWKCGLDAANINWDAWKCGTDKLDINWDAWKCNQGAQTGVCSKGESEMKQAQQNTGKCSKGESEMRQAQQNTGSCQSDMKQQQMNKGKVSKGESEMNQAQQSTGKSNKCDSEMTQGTTGAVACEYRYDSNAVNDNQMKDVLSKVYEESKCVEGYNEKDLCSLDQIIDKIQSIE